MNSYRLKTSGLYSVPDVSELDEDDLSRDYGSDHPTFDAFVIRLLEAFEVSYEGAIRTYLVCEIERDISQGVTSLSQKHYEEEVLEPTTLETESPISDRPLPSP
jgi:hypothetical protein